MQQSAFERLSSEDKAVATNVIHSPVLDALALPVDPPIETQPEGSGDERVGLLGRRAADETSRLAVVRGGSGTSHAARARRG